MINNKNEKNNNSISEITFKLRKLEVDKSLIFYLFIAFIFITYLFITFWYPNGFKDGKINEEITDLQQNPTLVLLMFGAIFRNSLLSGDIWRLFTYPFSDFLLIFYESGNLISTIVWIFFSLFVFRKLLIYNEFFYGKLKLILGIFLGIIIIGFLGSVISETKLIYGFWIIISLTLGLSIPSAIKNSFFKNKIFISRFILTLTFILFRIFSTQYDSLPLNLLILTFAILLGWTIGTLINYKQFNIKEHYYLFLTIYLFILLNISFLIYLQFFSEFKLIGKQSDIIFKNNELWQFWLNVKKMLKK